MFQFNPFTGTLDLNSGPGSYADDVLEFANLAAFPIPGEQGKIYVARDDNRAYRWAEGGVDHTSYREISALETHTHTGNQVTTTAAYSPDIPPLGGAVIFYPDPALSTAGERSTYRTASGEHYLWFYPDTETWTISEGPLFNLPENIVLTADEGDSAQLPWQAAWDYELLPLSLAGFTDAAIGTWATKAEVTSDRITAASDSAATATALATKATLPTDSSHAFSQSGQSLALQPARAQFVRVTMSFANGSASVQLPSSGQNYDEVIVDANVGANCTLTVGSIELANLNQYYGTGRRLLRFVRKNNIWNLYEHPYHTHTTNELIFAAAPQIATSPGRAGTISYAAGNLYVAVADNQWRRVALATW